MYLLLVLILTAHSNVDYKLVADNAALVLDTRDAMSEFATENVILL